ncbi:MAG: AAA family ATPase [Planctomycetaceae bacterium]|jgi:type II secretory pathway predicted ATPase ExeA|nr:AAA family ATPase [Planctomycetaceae bacterium]
MYETFFGLKRRPFLAVPDTESYFSTKPTEEARRSIERTVRRGEGIALLFGASGTGKTLLLRLLHDSLKTDYTVAMISNGHLETPKSFFQQLFHDLQLPFSGNDETELRFRLFDFARQNQTCVILIDESQFLNVSVLEEIRLLMNCDNGAAPFFRVVLAGTVEFEEKLTDPYLDAFNQRVVCRAYLESLPREETGHYITHQTNLSRNQSDHFSASVFGLTEWIESSGGNEERRIDSPHIRCSEPIFTENAQRQIFQLTDGLPRSINQLCDMALQTAAERNLHQIDESLVRYAWTCLQQITGYSEEKPAESICETIKPSFFENIDEIVARKKATFQPKTFDSPIEFGILDDTEPVETADEEMVEKEMTEKETLEKEKDENEEVTIIRFRSPNEYKPPYPEDDHWEEEYSESNLSETDSSEQDIIETINELLPLVPTTNNVREYCYSNEMPEIEESLLDFYEEQDNEILFSSESFPRLRELPISEELDDAIKVVAEAVAEKNITKNIEAFQTLTEENTEKIVAENVEVFQTLAEENTEKIVVNRLPKQIYPFRRQRVKKNYERKYRHQIIISTISARNTETPEEQPCCFRCHLFAVSIFRTFRRFDSVDTWIGNLSFYSSFISARFLISFRREPIINKSVINEQIIEEQVTDELITNETIIDNTVTENIITENTVIQNTVTVETITDGIVVVETETSEYQDIITTEFITTESVVMAERDDTVNNEPVLDEVIVDLNRKNCSEESEMDRETLEKYGAEILEGRQPFVRKEPNYAYQTTDSAPEIIGKVAYPDRVTGNVILLNWLKTEQNSENGYGTPYREFLTREIEDNRNVCRDHTNNQNQQLSYNEFDALRIVRVTLNQVTDFSQSFYVPQNQKTSLDELFDEVVTVETQAVSLKEPSDRCGSSYSAYLNNFSFPAQIEDAVRRITKAAEKIEQAAEQSNDAGRQIKQAAGFFETEIKTVLPTYVELFQELVEFQQTISNELHTKNQTAKEPTEHSNRHERPVRLLPFPVRMNTNSISSIQLGSEIGEISPTDTPLPNEKSIDFHSLFQ